MRRNFKITKTNNWSCLCKLHSQVKYIGFTGPHIHCICVHWHTPPAEGMPCDTEWSTGHSAAIFSLQLIQLVKMTHDIPGTSVFSSPSFVALVAYPSLFSLAPFVAFVQLPMHPSLFFCFPFLFFFSFSSASHVSFSLFLSSLCWFFSSFSAACFLGFSTSSHGFASSFSEVSTWPSVQPFRFFPNPSCFWWHPQDISELSRYVALPDEWVVSEGCSTCCAASHYWLCLGSCCH